MWKTERNADLQVPHLSDSSAGENDGGDARNLQETLQFDARRQDRERNRLLRPEEDAGGIEAEEQAPQINPLSGLAGRRPEARQGMSGVLRWPEQIPEVQKEPAVQLVHLPSVGFQARGRQGHQTQHNRQGKGDASP